MGEKGALPSSPRPDTSNTGSAISRESRKHLYCHSLPIILWYHTVASYYHTSRVPNYSRLQLFGLPSLRMVEYHSTPPIPRSFGLLSPGSNYRFLPHAVPSPGCVPIATLATTSLPRTFRETSMILRVYVLYVPDPHLPSCFITPFEMSLPIARAAAPPLRNECNAFSSGLRRDFATTSLTAWRTRQYLTILTELPKAGGV